MIEKRQWLVSKSGALLRYPPERAELENFIAEQGDQRLFLIRPQFEPGGPQACYFHQSTRVEESVYTHSGTDERVVISGPHSVPSGESKTYIARQGGQSLEEIAAALDSSARTQCKIAVETGLEVRFYEADHDDLQRLENRGITRAFLVEPMFREARNARARFFRFEADEHGYRRLTGPHGQSYLAAEEFINVDGSTPASALLRRLDETETR